MKVSEIDPLRQPIVEVSDKTRLCKEPVASVLMLAYNHGDYLSEAIDSILAQRADFPFELLIGDDCSSDNTRDIALRYQRNHPELIRVIYSASNVGMQRNHLRLVGLARGSFTAFCEGDDFWMSPKKLQDQVDYLLAHHDVGGVHTDFDHILLRSGRWCTLSKFHDQKHAGIPSGNVFNELLGGNFIQTCTLCVRTSLSQQYASSGLSVYSYPVGDWPLCLFIAGISKIAYLPSSTAVYRKVPGSAMNSGYVARSRTVARYIPMIDDICDHFLVPEPTRRHALTQIYRAQLSSSIFADDIPLFRETWDWLVEHDPDYLRPWRRRLLPSLAQWSFARSTLTLIDALRDRIRVICKYK